MTTIPTPTECGICIESFNKSKRKWVQCPYCPAHGSEIGVCISCVKTYLLQDDAPTPRCAACQSGWTEDFMTQTFAKTWLLKEYKAHRERILLDTERARLPEAQEDAGRYRRALQIVERVTAQIAPLQEQIKNLPEQAEENRLYAEYGRLNSDRVREEREMTKGVVALVEKEQAILATLRRLTHDFTDMEELEALVAHLPAEDPRKMAYDEFQDLRRQRGELEERNLTRRTELRTQESAVWRAFMEARTILSVARNPIQAQINALRNREYMQAVAVRKSAGREPAPRAIGEAGQQQERNRWTFVMKCTQEGCEGFVGTNWKCGLCEVEFCKECGDRKQSEHLCTAETRATFQALRKEAKPCPKCAAMISKIDGCDQMWCTQCQTAFSWRTGQIEISHIHNPHYFQWMRQNGTAAPPLRPVGDCLNLGPEELLEQVNHYAARRRHWWVTEWVRANRHYRWIHRMHQHTLAEKQEDDWRRQLRVKRLVNEITDDVWKDRLQRGEKATQKEYAIVQIMDLYMQASLDMLANTLPEDADVPAILEQLEALRKFCNDEMGKIQKRFNNEVVYFDEVRLRQWREF